MHNSQCPKQSSLNQLLNETVWYLTAVYIINRALRGHLAQLANGMVQRNLQIFERYQPAEGLGFDRVNSVAIKKPEMNQRQ